MGDTVGPAFGGPTPLDRARSRRSLAGGPSGARPGLPADRRRKLADAVQLPAAHQPLSRRRGRRGDERVAVGCTPTPGSSSQNERTAVPGGGDKSAARSSGGSRPPPCRAAVHPHPRPLSRQQERRAASARPGGGGGRVRVVSAVRCRRPRKALAPDRGWGPLPQGKAKGHSRCADSLAAGRGLWRAGRDSNPRDGYKPPTPLAGERLRPLGHLPAPVMAEGGRGCKTVAGLARLG